MSGFDFFNKRCYRVISIVTQTGITTTILILLAAAPVPNKRIQIQTPILLLLIGITHCWGLFRNCYPLIRFLLLRVGWFASLLSSTSSCPCNFCSLDDLCRLYDYFLNFFHLLLLCYISVILFLFGCSTTTSSLFLEKASSKRLDQGNFILDPTNRLNSCRFFLGLTLGSKRGCGTKQQFFLAGHLRF